MKPGAILDRWSVHYMLFIFLFNAFLFLCCCARDTITIDSPVAGKDTLVSAGERFVLGFFSFGPSAGSYIGIWHRSDPSTVVWVANREKPFSYTGGAVLAIENGNLSVTDAEGMSYWSRGPGSSVYPNITAQLLDSGNLVLREAKEGTRTILWQSFKEPTDTFLPGMNMDGNLQLVSWKDTDDPTSGYFTFKTGEEEKGYVIQIHSDPYWMSNGFFPSDDKISVVIGRPPFSSCQILKNISIFPGKYNTDQRLVMNSTGEIQNWSWDDKSLWTLNAREPRDGCSVYNACGNSVICKLNREAGNRDSVPIPISCTCLAGFRPVSTENWEAGNFSEGCIAEPIACQNHRFLNYTKLRIRKLYSNKHVENDAICSNECDCHCQAYSYDAPMKQFAKTNQQRGNPDNRGTCWLWGDDLINLREKYRGRRNLAVRVAVSDKESTSQNCEFCGAMDVPYPLNIGPNCGDPMYSSFQCHGSTSELRFNTSIGMCRVISIDTDMQTFTIFLKDGCEFRGSRHTISQLNQSLTSPFKINRIYSVVERICRIDIGWDPPAEPTCTSALDCKDWPESSCNATGNVKGRCRCNTNFSWNSSSLNCAYSSEVGGSDNLEKKSNADPRTNQLILIVLISVISVSALSCVAIVYIWRKYVRKSEDGAIQRNRVIRRFDSKRHAKDLIETSEFTEEDKKGTDVPFFEFESILAATDEFSKANKLGEGGYGPVYKGNFPGGQELAVKRLSSVSGQGLQEFKNEVVLIAKLQHRNLVKLWGYCVKGDEKILIYEYMPNRSLDAFIFDSRLAASLEWEIRNNIILGIARGLLYLHQDSRLRIIHRDMKTSNILLDGEMNPKISDFGMARIFGGKQNEANTNRVVGTYGYMAPEYALDGLFSVKSDVFSFGVVMLEIISGRRNTGFYRSQETLNLLGTAWQFWEEDDALKLMDHTLDQSCNRAEFVKCAHVGLLCVQEKANDGPDMATVMVMLGSESASLPSPKQPAFIARAGPSSSGIDSTSTGSKTQTCCDLTNTLVEGR